MKTKIFIDGREGTTGLQIEQRIRNRADLELLEIEPAKHKDPAERKKLLNAADAAFLCLPDDAARESAALVDNPRTVVIDTSTAHRTDHAWVYGLPELSAQHRERIQTAKRIANPGCHATGFIVCVYPLVRLGLLDPSAQLSCFSLTGYSGGGKKMIAEYEDTERALSLDSPRLYGLTQRHKHLAEMAAVCGLENPPFFTPAVSDFYSGMAVTVDLPAVSLLGGVTRAALEEALAEFYADAALFTVEGNRADGFIAANEMAGKPGLKLYAGGADGRITLTAVFDNLCKGASGAAVQNMNLALGLDEYASLL